jgi:hypothetical protein
MVSLMIHMIRRRTLLDNMIKMEERDIELIMSENKHAQEVLNEMECSIKREKSVIDDLESVMRNKLTDRSEFSIEELQSKRRYLMQLRDQLKIKEAQKFKALNLIEVISKRLTQKMKKVKKLRRMVGDVGKEIYQTKEKQVIKENDELWIQAQERSRC